MRDGVGGAGQQGSQVLLCTDRAVSYYCCALAGAGGHGLGCGPLTAWDGSDSLRLGREQVARVVTQHPSQRGWNSVADSGLHTDGTYLPCAQATEAAINLASGPLTAWDIPDSLRLGHERSAEVAMRRALCGTPLNARLTFARDGSVRIQVGSGPKVLTPDPKQCRHQ